MQHFVGAALPFAKGGAGAIDVGPCTRVRPIQEEHAGPEMDGFVVAAGEVLIETFDEQRFRATVPLTGIP